MLSDKELVQVSKLMSLALRHQPEVMGLSLDKEGWVEVQSLLSGLHSKGFLVDKEQLELLVATNSKKRFAFNEDHTRIRASQGHSLEVDLQLEPKQPPALLFHGTAEKNRASILMQGLQKQSRQQVHLSSDRETARTVGSRHGRPIVLEVAAAAMQEKGYVFYRSANGVWLTDHVPAEYIVFPQ
ncbi:MAG TPA: RNA 2'-phosphotransferase [Flavisolibacter sp.]|jgi:putative RNA 2'-phosphotransferase|nr:RNA 2'-phosphotransferase [Flavisolibacter sp.]